MKKIISALLALLTAATFCTSCSFIGGLGGGTQNQETNSSDSQGGGIVARLDMTKLAENIDAAAQYDFSNKKILGSAYYVYQDGAEFQKCYGEASVSEGTPISDTSIFRLASMTKPITAVAALILVEKGKLSLNDTVDKYIPEFENVKIIQSNMESYPDELPTIKNLLNHTSGIGCDADKLSKMSANDKLTLDNSIAFYIKKGLDFEPGSKQEYSPYGAFDVLTKIIEIASGVDYLSFLNKEIFQPCGMVDTTFEPNAEQQTRIVDMHTRKDGENAVHQMPAGCIFENFPSSHYLGGAGLVSTLRDYSKFAKMLLNKGKTDNGRILKEETFNRLCTPQVSEQIMPGNLRWGLGVRIVTEDTYAFLPAGSYGWSGAYGSHFWIDPVNKIFAVYMKNSTIDGGASNESSKKFEKAVYSSLFTV